MIRSGRQTSRTCGQTKAAVLGHRSRSVQPRRHRLAAKAAHDDRHCAVRVDDGRVSATTGPRRHALFRPWQPVREPHIPGQAQVIWHGLLDESQRKLLGQCPDRKLIQQFQKRTLPWPALRNTCSHEGGQL